MTHSLSGIPYTQRFVELDVSATFTVENKKRRCSFLRSVTHPSS